MNESRVALKVGVFVAVGGALIALLILNFTKGVTLGKSSYTLHVILPNAAGLKASADVKMAGVDIGKVMSEDLGEDGQSVHIKLAIVSRYKISKSALFQIDSLGFLGDQYVEVSAPSRALGSNQMDYLKDGDFVKGTASFNVLQAVQSVAGVIDQATKTIKDLDQAITNVNASALSTNTLAHFVLAVSNLQVVSERAVVAAGRAEGLLSSNSETFHAAIVNFEDLSERLTNTAGRLNEIVVTNEDDIHQMVTNLTVASERVRQIATDLEAGKGPAGTLLKDEQVKAELESIVSNANQVTAEFSTFGRNLNQRGVWSVLWKPKPPKSVDTNQSISLMRHKGE